MGAKFFIIILFMAAVSGCSEQPPSSSSSAQAVSTESGGAFTPFIVYQDKGSKNRFSPSGYMPDGSCIKLDDGWTSDPQEGKTSIRNWKK